MTEIRGTLARRNVVAAGKDQTSELRTQLSLARQQRAKLLKVLKRVLSMTRVPNHMLALLAAIGAIQGIVEAALQEEDK